MANGKLSDGRRWWPTRAQDEVCNRLKTLMQDEGWDLRRDAKKIAALADCAVTTINNLVDGTTRKPQYYTVSRIINSHGYREVFVRDKEKKIDREHEVEVGLERIRQMQREARERAEKDARKEVRKRATRR